MPLLSKKNTSEINGELRAKKKVSKSLLKSNASSQIVGTPKSDSENFNKSIDLMDKFLIEIVVLMNYLTSTLNAPPNRPGRLYSVNTSTILTTLLQLKKLVSKSSFTLYDIPPSDIQDLKDKMALIQGFDLTDIINEVDETGGIFETNAVDLLRTIQTQNEAVIQILNQKIMAHDAGTSVAVELEAKVGGCMCEDKYAMYQTKKFNVA